MPSDRLLEFDYDPKKVMPRRLSNPLYLSVVEVLTKFIPNCFICCDAFFFFRPSKPYLYFFDLTSCITKGTLNPVTYVKRGLSCPTQQVGDKTYRNLHFRL